MSFKLKLGYSFVNSVNKIVKIVYINSNSAIVECKDWKKTYEMPLETIINSLKKGIYYPVNFTYELPYEIY